MARVALACVIVCVVALATHATADADDGPAFIGSSVVTLTDATFDESLAHGSWFVKFYAPWCHFCKKLAPVWEEVASDLETPDADVHVGKVDCTTSSGPCDAQNLRGYPTLLFFRSGAEKPISYEGPRTRERLVEFARRAAGPTVADVRNGNALQRLRDAADVVFLYIGRPAGSAYAAFSAVATEQYVSPGLSFARADSVEAVGLNTAGEAPLVLALKDGTSVRLDGDITEESMRAFFSRERFPRVAHIESASYGALWAKEAPLVLLVADPANARATRHAQAALRAAADGAGPEQFAWIDGAYFSNKVRTTWGLSVADLPVVVYEAASRRAHAVLRSPSREEIFTEKDIGAFVDAVRTGKQELTERSAGGILGFFQSGLEEVNMAFQALYSQYPALAIMTVVFPALMIFILFLMPGAGHAKTE